MQVGYILTLRISYRNRNCLENGDEQKIRASEKEVFRAQIQYSHGFHSIHCFFAPYPSSHLHLFFFISILFYKFSFNFRKIRKSGRLGLPIVFILPSFLDSMMSIPALCTVHTKIFSLLIVLHIVHLQVLMIDWRWISGYSGFISNYWEMF